MRTGRRGSHWTVGLPPSNSLKKTPSKGGDVVMKSPSEMWRIRRCEVPSGKG